ncbi:MAG TPA: hypothetical protein VH518_01655 [Tepidisphaeraceae bacterium]|jgi:hypothetical protein
MRRILRLLFSEQPPPPPVRLWQFTPQQQRDLLEVLGDIGVRIVAEARGPVPLMTFGRRVFERLDQMQAESLSAPRSVSLPHFADALKRVILDMQHDRLRVLAPSTDFIGVGYVYNVQDPRTWPVRSSR